MEEMVTKDYKEKESHKVTFVTSKDRHLKAFLYCRSHGFSSEYIVDCIIAKEEAKAGPDNGLPLSGVSSSIIYLLSGIKDLVQKGYEEIHEILLILREIKKSGGIITADIPAEKDFSPSSKSEAEGKDDVPSSSSYKEETAIEDENEEDDSILSVDDSILDAMDEFENMF